MRIGIDARMINNSGIGTYIRNLISCVPQKCRHEFVLFGDPAVLNKYSLPVIEANYPIYRAGEQVFLPLKIYKAKLDLFHSPHYNIPLAGGVKRVVTIHDIIHILFPEYLPNRLAGFYARYFVGRACAGSAAVMTDSQNTKKDILDRYSVDPDKISVVHLPVDRLFRRDEARAAELKKKYGRFILYVGAVREHKNVISLVESFCELKKKHGIEHKLVLIGREKPEYYKRLIEISEKYNLSGQIIKPENLINEDLPGFYSAAELFVFPSYYEGFGLPPLEAMACGCPVVSSNASCMPEVLGDAALMVNPRDKQGLSDSIMSALTKPDIRVRLASAGYERVKLFAHDKFADAVIENYEKALKK